MLLYYVRHGDPIYDPDSLTERGHKQAAALANRMALYGLDEIYCSTSIRAQMTAQPTCERLGKEKTLLDWTNEAYAWEDFALKYGSDRYTWAFFNPELINKFNCAEVSALGKNWHEHPDFAGTNFARGVKRIDKETDAFLLSLGYEHDRENNRYKVVNGNEKRVALFAHQGFGIAFLSSLLDIPYPLYSTHFDLSHSSVTVIEFKNVNGYAYPKVLQHSNDSHLYKEGILSGYNNGINV